MEKKEEEKEENVTEQELGKLQIISFLGISNF